MLPQITGHYAQLESKLLAAEIEIDSLLATNSTIQHAKQKNKLDHFNETLANLEKEINTKKSTHSDDIKQTHTVATALIEPINKQYTRLAQELMEQHKKLVSEVKDLKFSETKAARDALEPLQLFALRTFKVFYDPIYRNDASDIQTLASIYLADPSLPNKNALKLAGIKLRALHNQLIKLATDSNTHADEKSKKSVAENISALENHWRDYIDLITDNSQQKSIFKPTKSVSQADQKKASELRNQKIKMLELHIKTTADDIAKHLPTINIEEQQKIIQQQQAAMREAMLENLNRAYEEKMKKLEHNKQKLIENINQQRDKLQKTVDDKEQRIQELYHKRDLFAAALPKIHLLKMLLNVANKQAEFSADSKKSHTKFFEIGKGIGLKAVKQAATQIGLKKVVERVNPFRDNNLLDILKNITIELTKMDLPNLDAETKKILRPCLVKLHNILEKHNQPLLPGTKKTNPDYKDINRFLVILTNEINPKVQDAKEAKEAKEKKRDSDDDSDDFVMVPDAKENKHEEKKAEEKKAEEQPKPRSPSP